MSSRKASPTPPPPKPSAKTPVALPEPSKLSSAVSRFMTGLYVQYLFNAATFFNNNQELHVSLKHQKTLPSGKPISEFKITHAYSYFDKRGKANIKGHSITFECKPDKGCSAEKVSVVAGYGKEFAVSISRTPKGSAVPQKTEVTSSEELRTWKQFITALLTEWDMKKMEIKDVLPASDNAVVAL